MKTHHDKQLKRHVNVKRGITKRKNKESKITKGVQKRLD